MKQSNAQIKAHREHLIALAVQYVLEEDGCTAKRLSKQESGAYRVFQVAKPAVTGPTGIRVVAVHRVLVKTSQYPYLGFSFSKGHVQLPDVREVVAAVWDDEKHPTHAVLYRWPVAAVVTACEHAKAAKEAQTGHPVLDGTTVWVTIATGLAQAYPPLGAVPLQPQEAAPDPKFEALTQARALVAKAWDLPLTSVQVSIVL